MKALVCPIPTHFTALRWLHSMGCNLRWKGEGGNFRGSRAVYRSENGCNVSLKIHTNRVPCFLTAWDFPTQMNPESSGTILSILCDKDNSTSNDPRRWINQKKQKPKNRD